MITYWQCWVKYTILKLHLFVFTCNVTRKFLIMQNYFILQKKLHDSHLWLTLYFIAQSRPRVYSSE